MAVHKLGMFDRYGCGGSKLSVSTGGTAVSSYCVSIRSSTVYFGDSRPRFYRGVAIAGYIATDGYGTVGFNATSRKKCHGVTISGYIIHQTTRSGVHR